MNKSFSIANSSYSNLVELSLSVERDVLTGMFIRSTKEIVECLQIVDIRDFKNYPKHFEAIQKIKIHKMDFASIGKEMGISIMEPISNIAPSNLKKSAERLKNISKAIKTLESIADISDRINDTNITESLSELQKTIAHIASEGNIELINIKEIIEDYTKKQEIYKLNGDKLLGFSCGFLKIDEAIDGIRPQHLWIIGGYTSIGKSSFAINIISSLLSQNVKVVLYSLEMSKIDLVSRLLALATNEKGRDILKGKGSEKTEEAKKILANSNLKIINEKTELGEIVLSMVEQKITWEADVFFVDYLQQIDVNGLQTEYDSMRESSKEFQKAARHLNVPIIALSQVSNEAAKSPTSTVIGFKGSGSIASASDFAIELVPNETDANSFREKIMTDQPVSIKAIIKKNRHGRTGTVNMTFNGIYGKFYETESVEKAEMDLFVKDITEDF